MNNDTGQADEMRRYSFLRIFANDGTIDADELTFLERLALRDGAVDDEERAALTAMLARVSEDSVTPAVWSEIEKFKARHGLA